MNNQNITAQRLVLNNWNQQVERVTKLLNSLSNEDLAKEIAPKRNTGVYLLGHLTAVHDAMLPLLGLGDAQFPELREHFLGPIKESSATAFSIESLKKSWIAVNEQLSQKMEEQSDADWFEPHTSVSREDFELEPHRNKLNVVLSRFQHLSHHSGQLVLLKNK